MRKLSQKFFNEFGYVIMAKKVVVKRTGGVPVHKKKIDRKKREPQPTKSYRANEVDITTETKDFTALRIPGNVEQSVKMRITDARGRQLISPEVYEEVLEIEGVRVGDMITVVPERMFNRVTGFIEKLDEKGNVTGRTMNPNWDVNPKVDKEPLPPLDVKINYNSWRDGFVNQPPKPKR